MTENAGYCDFGTCHNLSEMAGSIGNAGYYSKPTMGIELAICSLRASCSASEVFRPARVAGDPVPICALSIPFHQPFVYYLDHVRKMVYYYWTRYVIYWFSDNDL